MTVRFDGISVDWFGYATARIEWPDGTVVYTDPGRYGVLTGDWTADSAAAAAAHPPATDYRAQDGDVVVVTHNHHYDSDGIERVAKPDATVVVYDAVYAGEIDRDVVEVSELPSEVLRVSDETDIAIPAGDSDTGGDREVILRMIEAYNDPDGRNVRANGDPIHPEGFGCGYLLTVDGTTAFWPGDTDALPGHAELDVDVFLPPIGRNFTMNREEAAELAGEMQPELVVPIHYNTFETLEADSEAFAADVAKQGIPVALDER